MRVAEDDARLAGVLAQSLAAAGWQVDVQHDGATAFHADHRTRRRV